MDVTLPNGTVIRGVPEGTNKWTVAEKAIQRGLATPEDFGQESADPTEGMSGFEKFRAGWGKAAVDLARGAGQMVGAVSRDDVGESRRMDAPLMEHGAAKAGNFAGTVANFVPAAFIPGANTVAGATAIGTGTGLLMPSESTKETLTNVGLGGATGGGSVAAIRGGTAAYRGGKALLEPFTKGGQRRIAARTMQAFAGGADDAARAADEIELALRRGNLLPGVKPTTAELAKNPGLAQFERTLRNNPEYMTELAGRIGVNKQVMIDALDQIAGTPAKAAAVRGARQSVTQQLYREGDQVMVQADDTFRSLMERPSMKSAWARAQNLAKENGESLVVGRDIPEQVVSSPILDDLGRPMQSTRAAQSAEYSGRGLHYLKRALDDMADNPQTHGLAGNEARAIKGTRNSLNDWMKQQIPEFGAADKLYSRFSRPLNQMEVGTALRNKLQPALADFGATGRTRAQSYAQALREGDRTAAQATGFKSAKMQNVMSPRQMKRMRQIGEQLGRRANADELGRAVGSNTGQNLVSQNVMRQFLGPLGLPESTMQRVAESTLLQSVMRPVQFAGQLGERRAMQALVDAALDPRLAEEWLRLGVNPRTLSDAVLRNQQFALPVALGANAARE